MIYMILKRNNGNSKLTRFEDEKVDKQNICLQGITTL